ncbi:hypothetical protein CSOJ01_12601 [Colletotrichum sojae]|uniref:ABM domain-containing protein n=1 Tax=Colletotrichum sojae TaxID=2175907 RepID=A0A8H6MME0_9PEZI|nr:hypothetical protein CSOJ01_12601 [Colletotrichum sojae]
MSSITEFIIITLRNPSPEPPAAWADVTSTLKSVPGVTALYSGRQIEDPSKAVLVVTWASPAAFSAFAASESYTPWFASLKAVAAKDPTPVFYKVPFASDPAAALGAPCTEVFVAYGVDADFAGKTAEFAAGLSTGPVAGYHGNAYGEITTPLAVGDDGEKGPAVTLLLGWDSKEAHLDAKGKPGPISDNIHLLRSGRKDISMYHVNLERV